MEKNLFNPFIFSHKISIKINELNNIKSILDLLNIKVKELENKCFEYGYIKENSIEILNYSQGYLNPVIFVPFIEYKITCKADIFIPNINDIYLATVSCINKIGIKCIIPYTNKNNTYNPINIIISKHNQKQENITNLKKGETSKPIKINENYLILQIDDVKINKQNIDKNKILSNRISYKRNQQLERFSLAYFGKIKQNIQINEF